MGFSLKDFFDDVIPNEIKKFAKSDIGKAALAGAAIYAGVKYAPTASKALFGTAEVGGKGGSLTGYLPETKGFMGSGGFKQTMGSVFGMEKYGYDKGIFGRMTEQKGGFLGGAGKFIKGMGTDTVSKMLGYSDVKPPSTMAAQVKGIDTSRYKGKYSGATAGLGNYRSTTSAAPGFKNDSTQTALANVMKYWNDVAMGNIPSVSYTVAGPSGVTIDVGSTKLGELT